MTTYTEITNIIAFGMPGGGEWVILFIIVLLLFGAKKLPELARGIGKSTGEFKRARDEFEREISRSEAEATQPKETKKIKESASNTQD